MTRGGSILMSPGCSSSCHLPCQGHDLTARVPSDRSHKGLEPQGDMRGGVLACSTACTSNQRRGLPTQSWYQEFEHFPGLLGQAFLFQPPDHPQIVKRTAKKRLKRMKAFVKYFSMRKSMKEQSWDFWTDSWGKFAWPFLLDLRLVSVDEPYNCFAVWLFCFDYARFFFTFRWSLAWAPPTLLQTLMTDLQLLLRLWALLLML